MEAVSVPVLIQLVPPLAIAKRYRVPSSAAQQPLTIGRNNVANGDLRVSRKAVEISFDDSSREVILTRVGSSCVHVNPDYAATVPDVSDALVQLKTGIPQRFMNDLSIHLVLHELVFVVKWSSSSKTGTIASLAPELTGFSQADESAPTALLPTLSADNGITWQPTQETVSPPIITDMARKRSRAEISASPSSPGSATFADIHIIVYPFGSDVSTTKIGIWCKQITKLGGECQISDRPFQDALKVANEVAPQRVVVIIDEHITSLQLRRNKCEIPEELALDDPDVCKLPFELHTPAWLIESLTQRKPSGTAVCVWSYKLSSPLHATASPLSSPKPHDTRTTPGTAAAKARIGAITDDHPFWDVAREYYPACVTYDKVASASKSGSDAFIYGPNGMPTMGRPHGYYQYDKGTVPTHLLAWLYSLGDDLARIGTSPDAAPLACAFEPEQISRVNASLLRTAPWLMLAIPPRSSSSTQTPAGAADSGPSISASNCINPFGLVRRPNKNKQITDVLSQLLGIYACLPSSLGEDYPMKHKQLEAAIGTIAAYGKRIGSSKELQGVPTLDAKTLEKVDEILQTGMLHRSAALLKHPRTVALQQLCKVHGVGPSEALRLFQLGACSVSDLRTKFHSALKPHQQISLPFTEALQGRLTRKECEQVLETVSRNAEAINPGIRCMLVGSYRRGKPSCSDVDILIAIPSIHRPTSFMSSLHSALSACGLLQEDLHWGSKRPDEAQPRQVKKSVLPSNVQTLVELDGSDCDDHLVTNNVYLGGDSEEAASITYLGICRIPSSTSRKRIDIKCVRIHQLPCALIQWTGNILFNRSLRLYANHLGFDLNELGLYPRAVKDGLLGGAASRHHIDMKTPPFQSEFDVFSYLGLHYIPPTERNVGDLTCCYED